MPDPKRLTPGDTIRIVSVPEGDRTYAAAGAEHAIETMDVLQWMVGREYEIWMVDEYGSPWVIVHDFEDGGHSIAITDRDSWILSGGPPTSRRSDNGDAI